MGFCLHYAVLYYAIKFIVKISVSRLLPFLSFTILVGILALALRAPQKESNTWLVGNIIPIFNAPLLFSPQTLFSNTDLPQHKSYLINFWASWCRACHQEHHLLLSLSKKIPVYGINYKDTYKNASDWLSRWGNPYHTIITDSTGRIAIDFGLKGVPETIFVDDQGVIKLHHVGPLTEDIVEKISNITSSSS